MNLYAHQQKIIDEDPKWTGLWLGTGSAKSRTALELSKGRVLVIVPKDLRLEKKFEKECERFGIARDLTVLSKEEFRRDWKKLDAFDTVIIDEFHFFTGIQPTTIQRKGIQYPKVSQMFEALYSYLTLHPPDRLYLLTATPVSKPLNAFAIGVILKKWGMNRFFEFRNKYYIERKMGFRSIWLPRNDEQSKQSLVNIIKKTGYTGQLSDYFDVPEQTSITHFVELTKHQTEAMKTYVSTEADPMVRRAKQRIIENGCLYLYDFEKLSEKEDIMKRKTITFPSEKVEYIKERALEFDKLLVFANYTGQVNAIAESLKEAGYVVYTLTGATKDRANVIQDAENSPKCVFVVQSTISAGWEAPSFPCMIFASLNWQSLHHIQSKGRILRSNHLKKNLYIYLVVRKGVDHDCFNAIMSGQNFNEKVYE